MTRPDDEQSIFTELEQSMEIDLSSWRASLLELFEHHLPLMIDEIGRVRGRPVDLACDDDQHEVGRLMREFLFYHWLSLQQAPMNGATITASGRGIFQIYEGDSYDIESTEPTTRITGTVDGFDLQPYVDPTYLDVMDAAPDECIPTEPYQRPFGLHLVLRDAIVTDMSSPAEPQVFDGNLIYLPLHYPKVDLRVIAA